jgi:hypothetical protein
MRFDEAVALADQAAAISRAIEERFPYAISFALLDQARYQLFATPEDPQQAWQICQDVIRYWPDVREREQQLLPVRRSLAWYQLAGGDEDDAVATLKTVFPEITPAGIEQELMLGYLELARLFSVLPAERQPEQIHSWVSRAIELAPSQPSLRLLAARVARMHDDLDATQRQLEAAAEIALAQQNEQAAAVPVQRLFEWLPDTERIQASLKRLRKEYPDSQLLKDFEQSLRVSTQSSATTGPANP